MKAHLLCEAHETFEGTNLQIVTGGKEYLGGCVGNRQLVRGYIASRVQKWITNVEALSEIVLCHPQAALTVLTHGLANKWTYLMRVSSGGDDSWNKLEEALWHKFLPVLTGRQAFSDLERELLSHSQPK